MNKSTFFPKTILTKLFPWGITIPPSGLTSVLICSGSKTILDSVFPLRTNNVLWLGAKKRSVVSRIFVVFSFASSNILLGNLTPSLIVWRSNKNFSLIKLLISNFSPSLELY